MNLYLSSFRLGRETDRLVELAGDVREVAFIPNALDAAAASTRTAVIERGVDDLEQLGFRSTLLDLRDYFGERSLVDALSRFRVLFATGGNVFVLRRAMSQSGLDSYLRDRRDAEDMLYAGYSAGACVVGSTLEGLHRVDDPLAVPSGYRKATIWEGLGLIDSMIIPHYGSDHHEADAMSDVVEYCIEREIRFTALRDGEVVIRRSVANPGRAR